MIQKKQTVWDVLIIGAGPAGLTAAIYAARSLLKTVVIDVNITGGQVATTYHIENYPGTKGAITGTELMENMRSQALNFGAQIDEMKKIVEVNLLGEEKKVITEDNEYIAKTIIIATGAEPRKLPIEKEGLFHGKGLHYCATCDAPLYLDADLAVVGGGVAALEEAEFLTKYAKSVTIIHRRDEFRAPKPFAEEILKNPKISLIADSIITDISGGNFVEGIEIENLKTGEKREMKLDGVFVYIGSVPSTKEFKDQINLTDSGFVLTDENMKTNIPGVFCAGDVREKEVRQVTTAVSDGSIAAVMAEKYISRP